MYSIITYCSENYLPKLSKTIGSWCNQESVDKIYVYTDDPNHTLISGNYLNYLNIFEPCVNFGDNCARKVLSFKHFIENYQFENLLFIDVDCLIIKDLGCLFNEEFDVGVTVYPEVKPKYQTRNISSGFIAIKNTVMAKNMINLWLEIQENISTHRPCRDQKSLSEAITEMRKGLKANIKLLDGNVYNSHPYSGDKGFIKEWLHRIKINKPYILHFASGSIDSQQIIDSALIACEE